MTGILFIYSMRKLRSGVINAPSERVAHGEVDGLAVLEPRDVVEA